MLSLFNNTTLIFTTLVVQFVASKSCENTSLAWSTDTIPWRIRHDPIKNSETIIPLPSLSQTSESTDGTCGQDKLMFQCQGC